MRSRAWVGVFGEKRSSSLNRYRADRFGERRSDRLGTLLIKPEGRWNAGEGRGKSGDLEARWSDSVHPRIKGDPCQPHQIELSHAVTGSCARRRTMPCSRVLQIVKGAPGRLG